MYNSDLEEINIDIEDVFLDPNNPRLWTEKNNPEVPDAKSSDEKIQSRIAAAISKYGIEELYYSILRNGFLPLDRIVVREIEGKAGKYVVVEGNRRLAALQLLRARIDDAAIIEDNIDEEYLENLKRSTDTINVLLYKGSESHDIAWMLQGIRHIGGVRDWGPAQKGKLVADEIENKGMSFKEAGQAFGLTPRSVGRLYRTYKALEQMRSDEDFQDKAKNEYFSLFEEAIGNSAIKGWLNWNEDNKQFDNIDNLKRFYSWIIPDEDNEDKRRIHDPRHIKKLAAIIEGDHNQLLDRFEAHEITIENAFERAIELPSKFDWKTALDKAEEILTDIPIQSQSIMDGSSEFLQRLEKLAGLIDRMKKFIMDSLGINNN